MANNTLATLIGQMPKLLDDLVMQESVTGVFENGLATGQVRSIGIKGSYQVLKMSYDGGLKDYKRDSGFETGGVTTEWETLTATYDRSKSFIIDAVDDQIAGEVASRTLGDFIRTKVVPELDAYRLAKYATSAGTEVSAESYTKTTAVKAIDTALETLGDAGYPDTGAVIFCTYGFRGLLEEGIGDHRLDEGDIINHRVKMYNGNYIVPVSKSRFYSSVDLTTGFAKGASAVDLHFLVIRPEAVVQLIEHQAMRMFTPAENQTHDAYKLDYRVYGDCWVLDNKKSGIYVGKSTT